VRGCWLGCAGRVLARLAEQSHRSSSAMRAWAPALPFITTLPARTASTTSYRQHLSRRAGEELFALGSASDCLWVLECGAVTCRVDFTQSTVASRAQMHALPPDTRPHYAERRLTYGPGSIVGELDFFLQRPRRCWQALASVADVHLALLGHVEVAALAGMCVAKGSATAE
jgi:CRP-like cAMP-binding protein